MGLCIEGSEGESAIASIDKYANASSGAGDPAAGGVKTLKAGEGAIDRKLAATPGLALEGVSDDRPGSP